MKTVDLTIRLCRETVPDSRQLQSGRQAMNSLLLRSQEPEKTPLTKATTSVTENPIFRNFVDNESIAAAKAVFTRVALAVVLSCLPNCTFHDGPPNIETDRSTAIARMCAALIFYCRLHVLNDAEAPEGTGVSPLTNETAALFLRSEQLRSPAI